MSRAVIALIIANIIWGAAPPIFKYSLENIPPFTLAFARFFFAALIFIPYFPMSGIGKLTRKEWTVILLAAVLGISVNISFFFLGLEKADSINAPVIASAGPLFLAIAAYIFFHEKLRMQTIIGMIISFLGVMVIVISPLLMNPSNPSADTSGIEGNILYIIATIGAGSAPLLLKSILKKVNVYLITFLTFMIASATFIPFMYMEFQTWSIFDLTWQGFSGVLFGVFLSSALGYYLYYYAMNRISLAEVGLFTYINPIVAVIVAIPLVHEYPDIAFIIGSAFVFWGIIISEKKQHHHPHHKLH